MHPGASAPQTLSVPLLNSAPYDSPDLGEYMAATIPIYGDAQIKGVADANAGRLMGVVTTMPSAGSCKGCAVLYEGAEGTYSKHTIYASDGTAWTAVGKVVTVDSSVTAGSSNPVTGGAVASRLENYQTKVSGAASTIDTEDLAASCALVSNANGKVAVSPVTSTELGYLGGVKSNVQTQLDGKQAKGDYATAAALSDGLEGKLDKTAKAESAKTADSATKASQDGSGNVISTTYLKAADAESAYAKKADVSKVYRPCGSVASVSALPESPSEGDVYSVEAEFTYQSKKYPAGTNVAWVAANGDVAGHWDPLGGTVDLSAYQKKSVGTASRALVTNGSGVIAASDITATELGYLDGVTSGIQAQLNGKLSTAGKAKSAETADSATQATKATQDGSGNVISDTYLAKTDAASTYLKKADADFTKAISAEGVAVSWTADASVSGYSYKGTIALQGVTSEYMPFVTFSATQASSGNFCPVAESGANAIYIWSKTNDAVTVPSVAAAKM